MIFYTKKQAVSSLAGSSFSVNPKGWYGLATTVQQMAEGKPAISGVLIQRLKHTLQLDPFFFLIFSLKN